MRRYRFKYSLKRQKERKNIITNNININDNNNNKEKKKKEDSVDWEGVRSSDVGKISEAIHGRGQENNLSERIHDFLNRIANAHGRLDLEWLRDVSDEQAKDFLLSIFGLGLKSVECIRLLSLHQVAFPVFCTKKAPNCNACPLRSECKHFASSFASAKLPLPWHDHSTSGFADSSNHNNLDPIIEEPSTPSREESPEMVLPDIEDLFCSDSDEIPSVKLDMNSFAKNVKEAAQGNIGEVQNIDDFSRALVALPPSVASIPLPILKNLGRLRTIHDAYELQDNHHILKSLNFEERIPEDPSPYLLIIWDSDKNNTSESCVPLSQEERNQYVQGSVLIPSRTAMRGSFPLNGTYFQVNEVFADHYTAEHPIKVSRDEIWRLRKSPCLFGTSVSTIFKGLSTKTIQLCFWRGFICLREFDRATRTPQPLSQWFHKTKTRSSNKTV
ncbi:hypothetical protein LUZ60_015579 [Juncus effusus]|nr:hypothetical protein LUZ60_015579 [Juncus effusus]